MLEFLGLGLFFGLVAGVSPDPLLFLVFGETLRGGFREGVKVALVPLVTDLPIVAFVLVVLSQLVEFGFVLGLIALVGAAYLVYLGVENLRVKMESLERLDIGKGGALRKGVAANFLSPSPYLFWLSIGGPIFFRSLEVHVGATVLFVLGFYCLLVGSKFGIALVVNRSKRLVESRYYVYVLRVLGVALILFALVFVKDGLTLLRLL